MNVCPECNRTMGKRNYELFIAGLCPSCASKYITKQAERIKELEEELDAECRVSQMLLANKKKQTKRIKNLEAENKTLKKMLREESYEFTDFSEIKTLNS